MKLFPRLCDKFQIELDDEQTPYYKIIEEDEDCKILQKRITDEIQHNSELLNNYTEIWLPFKSQWEVDKNIFMRKYEAMDIDSATFDANIGRFSEVANQVSMQETITTVYFLIVYANNLKNSILSHIDDWQKRHTELLRKKSYEKITSKLKLKESEG